MTKLTSKTITQALQDGNTFIVKTAVEDWRAYEFHIKWDAITTSYLVEAVVHEIWFGFHGTFILSRTRATVSKFSQIERCMLEFLHSRVKTTELTTGIEHWRMQTYNIPLPLQRNRA